MTYEYKLEPQPRDGDIAFITEYLNSFGADGWELAGIDYGHFIFKRPVSVPYGDAHA